jgi:hypothetical protein
LASHPFPSGIVASKWLDMGKILVDPFDPKSGAYPLASRSASQVTAGLKEGGDSSFTEAMLNISEGLPIYVPNISTSCTNLVRYPVSASYEQNKKLVDAMQAEIDSVLGSCKSDLIRSSSSQVDRPANNEPSTTITTEADTKLGELMELTTAGSGEIVKEDMVSDSTETNSVSTTPFNVDIALEQRLLNLRRAAGLSDNETKPAHKVNVVLPSGVMFEVSNVPFPAPLGLEKEELPAIKVHGVGAAETVYCRDL